MIHVQEMLRKDTASIAFDVFFLSRSYFLRRIKDGFREGSTLQDPAKVQVELERARNLLDVLKRQVIVFGFIFDTHRDLWNDVEVASFANRFRFNING